METLPDYLRVGLDIVFVGINPSAYSVRVGHYFGNPRNRFWTAFNMSGLVAPTLTPELDHTLLDHGIGFTDLVKRPTPQASGLNAGDFRHGAPMLKEKLERCHPLIVCFQGITAYRQYLTYGEGVQAKSDLVIGRQERPLGNSRVYVAPSPSPANARYSVDDLAGWYRDLKAYLEELKPSSPALLPRGEG